jgi:hypothetical protein
MVLVKKTINILKDFLFSRYNTDVGKYIFAIFAPKWYATVIVTKITILKIESVFDQFKLDF